MVGLDNPIHLLIVLVIVLLVFGAKRLPEMGRSLGAGLRGFKETVSGDSRSRLSGGDADPLVHPVTSTPDPAEPRTVA